MKALVIALVFTFGVLGVLGWLAKDRGPKWSEGHTERMRGNEAYYDQGASVQKPVEPVRARILSDDEKEAVFMVLDFDFSYRLGREVDEGDAEDLVEDRQARLRDALHVHLSDFTVAEFDTLPGKFRLKRKLRDIVQSSVFPEELARVDDVLFKQVLVQRVRHD